MMGITQFSWLDPIGPFSHAPSHMVFVLRMYIIMWVQLLLWFLPHRLTVYSCHTWQWTLNADIQINILNTVMDPGKLLPLDLIRKHVSSQLMQLCIHTVLILTLCSASYVAISLPTSADLPFLLKVSDTCISVRETIHKPDVSEHTYCWATLIICKWPNAVRLPGLRCHIHASDVMWQDVIPCHTVGSYTDLVVWMVTPLPCWSSHHYHLPHSHT